MCLAFGLVDILWHSIWHFIGRIFWHSIWHPLWHSIWHLAPAVAVRQCPLHWDLVLAVEVLQCPLTSGACGWQCVLRAPLTSGACGWAGSAHWDPELAVEIRGCRRRRRRRRRRKATLIKSTDHHLAGGEKYPKIFPQFVGNWFEIVPRFRAMNETEETQIVQHPLSMCQKVKCHSVPRDLGWCLRLCWPFASRSWAPKNYRRLGATLALLQAVAVIVIVRSGKTMMRWFSRDTCHKQANQLRVEAIVRSTDWFVLALSLSHVNITRI